MTTTTHHLVVGSGPVGATVARQLAERGERVVVVTRSGTAPAHRSITAVRGDATDAAFLAAQAQGAAAIYNAVNPPYHRWAMDWPPLGAAFLTAAERSGAVLVMMDNLYAFGPDAPMPMRETDPMRATGTKGLARRRLAEDLLAAHSAGRVRATLARASDFWGPEVRGSSLGGRVVPRLLAGKPAGLLGDLDVAHSVSFMPDVARTLVTLATDERAWGRAWHVPSGPARTQREMVGLLADAAGVAPKMSSAPWPVIRAMGLFVPFMRELRETRYQFDRPWVVDASETEATFGLVHTPHADAAAATVAWWRAQPAS
jgi:nucleoside-diphosphate-sugar epimerase